VAKPTRITDSIDGLLGWKFDNGIHLPQGDALCVGRGVARKAL